MPKKIVYNSPVVLTFAIISLVVLFLNKITGDVIIPAFFTLFLSEASDPLQYVRMFTHVIGHANWEHYAGNMTLLLLTGPMLEEKYGAKTFSIIKEKDVNNFLLKLPTPIRCVEP